MTTHVILISLPGLRGTDLAHLPRLAAMTADRTAVVPSFPGVSRVVQANMVTGCLPSEHGVVGDRLYLKPQGELLPDAGGEAWGSVAAIWDVLRAQRPGATSAACWTTYAGSCGAEWSLARAAGDGSGAAVPKTGPAGLAEELVAELGAPPPGVGGRMAPDRPALLWMSAAAVSVARRGRPRFMHVSLPHVDAVAQRFGPDSPEARAQLSVLDEAMGVLAEGLQTAFAGEELLWLIASEYVVTPVARVVYPNRRLREAGLLTVRDTPAGQVLDMQASRAWALTDRQAAHVYLRDDDPAVLKHVQGLFAGQAGIADALCDAQRGRYHVDHPRCGDAVLVSTADSWQAYDYWPQEADAPQLPAEQQPGCNPAELWTEPGGYAAGAEQVRGSHGAPALDESQRGVILCSEPGVLVGNAIADTDVAGLVLRQFAL